MWTTIKQLLIFVLLPVLAVANAIQQTVVCGTVAVTAVIEPHLPTTPIKYKFVEMRELLPSVNICNATTSTLLSYAPTVSVDGVHILTRCDQCTTCLDKLKTIHNVAMQLASETRMNSLLILVQSAKTATKFDGATVSFAFANDIPNNLANTPCEFNIASANGVGPDGGNSEGDALRSFSKTSVLFVSISFIILMVISLAWLVFYYVQRFRYAHAKDRMQRRLFNAAKKALAKIPTRQLRQGDLQLDADCPVCIDPYNVGDVIRTLPCRHIFHKTCVDPWLLEHRTCPMCKQDILKAFGMNIVNSNGRRRPHLSSSTSPGDPNNRAHSQDSDHGSEDETNSDSQQFPYPTSMGNDIQDPFGFTPSTSPQLVMHAKNARGFSIIPLTVHSTSERPAAQASSAHQADDLASVSTASATGSASSSRVIVVPSSSSSKGHVVNLVHVRSRSLTQNAQERPSTVGGDMIVHHPQTVATFRAPRNSLPDRDVEAGIANVRYSATLTLAQRRMDTPAVQRVGTAPPRVRTLVPVSHPHTPPQRSPLPFAADCTSAESI
uniref:RING-type domain-containing protein n=1 Tax=Steinernema glaseri TaxID=37863 RepID=A0A1I7YCE5_9BILA